MNTADRTPSIVEQTLLAQRDQWKDITDRISKISDRDLPHEVPKRIIFFGLGSSYFASRLCMFALKRDKTRPRLPVIGCSSMNVGADVIPAKGDWVFALTHRGGSARTMEALELAERLGAFTMAVTGKGVENPKASRFQLETVELEKVEPHTSAVTGAVCAVTTLLMGQKAVDEWQALTSIGHPDLELCRSRAGQGPNVILGEWEGEVLAREASLKLLEMSKLRSRAYSSEEYFHGPHIAKRDEDVVWHVSMPKDYRNDQIIPDYRVGVFGASPLAWVPALIELQWMSLAVALNRGINPDTANPDS
jgi:fructoselysine-6-P-deglycase FrlB-like protein